MTGSTGKSATRSGFPAVQPEKPRFPMEIGEKCVYRLAFPPGVPAIFVLARREQDPPSST